MTLCSVEHEKDSDGLLHTLADAMAGRRLPKRDRVLASPDSRSTSEGLALLGAYIGIADAQTRQAVLDLVLTLARGVAPG